MLLDGYMMASFTLRMTMRASFTQPKMIMRAPFTQIDYEAIFHVVENDCEYLSPSSNL